MNELIAEIRAAVNAGLYYLALIGALALPDICGALASDNGRATPSKYKTWMRENVPEQGAEADEVYGLRCSILHQGSALPHGGLWPVVFTFPPAVVHNLSVEDAEGNRIGCIAIPMFVEEVTRGAERWLTRFGETRTVKRNLEGFAHYRPDGIDPIIKGSPVIG